MFEYYKKSNLTKDLFSLEAGKCIIISAPSGAGKTTIVHYLLKQELGLEFSISATSRSKREGEENGREYYFLTEEEFKTAINNGDFVEWEQVYKGQYYGTLEREVERIWNKGKTVIFDVDVLGGMNLKKKFGQRALAIFIQPPSLEELENRLVTRGTETREKIDIRLERARIELEHSDNFDLTIVNDHLENACKVGEEHIRKFINH